MTRIEYKRRPISTLLLQVLLEAISLLSRLAKKSCSVDNVKIRRTTVWLFALPEFFTIRVNFLRLRNYKSPFVKVANCNVDGVRNLPVILDIFIRRLFFSKTPRSIGRSGIVFGRSSPEEFKAISFRIITQELLWCCSHLQHFRCVQGIRAEFVCSVFTA